MIAWPPETATMAVISLEARPVEVMQPATIPAMAQATATVMVPLPPASKASMNLFTVMRSSLLKRLTMMVITMATAAQNCMVRRSRETMTTSTTRGSSR